MLIFIIVYKTLAAGDIFGDKVNPAITLDHFRGAKLDRVLVQADVTHDAPPTAFLHPAPVFVGGFHNLVRGKHADGLIPVLDFYGIETHVDNDPIGIKRGDFQPVAFPDQILRGDLYAGNKSHNSILKSKEQDDGQRPQSAQEEKRGFTIND